MRSAGSRPGTNVLATWRRRRDTRCRSTALPTDLDTIRPIRGPFASVPSVSSRKACTTTSGCAARTPRLTVTLNSADRLIRFRAGSTALHPACACAGSRSERATALATPIGNDRAAGAGAHPQPEPVNTRTAAVVGLEGPLALGHGNLSLYPYGDRGPSTLPCRSDAPTVTKLVKLRRSCFTNRRGLRANPGAAVSPRAGDCSRVLTRFAWVKPAPTA